MIYLLQKVKGENGMQEKRWTHRKEEFSKAVKRLEESLQLPVNHTIVIDGVIQRFEFTYELAWKCLKDYLEYTGAVEAKTPRDVIKEAFAIGFIANGDVYISMLKDRNLTSHTYNEEMSHILYKQIKLVYYPLLFELDAKLKKVNYE